MNNNAQTMKINKEEINKQIKFHGFNYNAIDTKLSNEGMETLRNCPQMHTDTIQDMEFIEMPNGVKLVSVSWDKTLIIWNCNPLEKKNNFSSNNLSNKTLSPLPKEWIGLSFQSKIELESYGLGVKYYQEIGMVLVNCGDCTIKALNIGTLQLQNMILLSALALDFFYIPQANSYIVVTLDGNLHIYNSNNLQQPMTYKLPGCPLAADINSNIMVIAMNDHKNIMFQINSLFNNFDGNFYLQNNLLESPISKIKINIMNNTYVSSTIDSRLLKSNYIQHNNGAIEIPTEKKKGNSFLFMAHGIKPGKDKANSIGHAYNINSLNLNPQAQNFVASGSSDGCVNFWDLEQKTKIKNFEFHQSLSCGTISKSGRFAAYAIGYDWSKSYWDISMAPDKPTIATFVFNNTFLSSKPQ